MHAYRITTLSDHLDLVGKADPIPANTTVIISDDLYHDNIGAIQEANVAVELVDAGKGISVNLHRVIPTTTQIDSSDAQVTILEENLARRGFSIQNRSSAILYLTFDSNPATIADTAFIDLAPGVFFAMDRQLVPGCAIYGVWSSVNGHAQVTEYV